MQESCNPSSSNSTVELKTAIFLLSKTPPSGNLSSNIKTGLLPVELFKNEYLSKLIFYKDIDNKIRNENLAIMLFCNNISFKQNKVKSKKT